MRQALANELRGVSTSRAETLFKVRGELLERALAATKSYVAGSALLLPAYQRYSGVVWSHLEAETLAPFTRDRILIPSGLYGVTTSSDGIADYRLTMNVSVTSIGKVAAFWKPMVTEVLTQKTSGALLFDLLPNEHRAAIDGGRLAQHCELVTVNFVSHDGKKLLVTLLRQRKECSPDASLMKEPMQSNHFDGEDGQRARRDRPFSSRRQSLRVVVDAFA